MNTQDAKNVLRILTGGFVNVAMTQDNVDTYIDTIAEKVSDPAIGMAVAVDWVETRLKFPTIAEFIDECAHEIERRRRRARATAQAQARHERGSFACLRCEDRRTIEIRTESGGMTVIPCPDCDPEESKYWTDGHYAPEHDVGSCEHPRCKKRQHDIESKVRNRNMLQRDDSERLDPTAVAEILDGMRGTLTHVDRPRGTSVG